MIQKSLGYVIKKKKKKKRFYRVPEKTAIFKQIKDYKILRYELDQRLLCQKLFWIQYFDSSCKDIKRNWVSTLFSSEMYGLSIG